MLKTLCTGRGHTVSTKAWTRCKLKVTSVLSGKCFSGCLGINGMKLWRTWIVHHFMSHLEPTVAFIGFVGISSWESPTSWRHDNFLQNCAFVDSCKLSTSAFFSYNANLFGFFPQVNHTNPAHWEELMSFWFRFKNTWKCGFHYFWLMRRKSTDIAHGGSHTFLRAQWKYWGDILPLNLREKKNEGWGRRRRARLLLHSSWKSVGEKKKQHNIADVLGCWPTVFWNYNVSTWWIITVIKMELSGERACGPRRHAEQMDLSFRSVIAKCNERSLGLQWKMPHLFCLKSTSTFTQHRAQHGKVRQIGAAGLCWTILLVTIHHSL